MRSEDLKRSRIPEHGHQRSTVPASLAPVLWSPDRAEMDRQAGASRLNSSAQGDRELASIQFIPELVFAQAARYTPEQERALRFYVGTRFQRNRLALELVRANLLFDNTLDASGRIVNVRLSDVRSQFSISPPGTPEARQRKIELVGGSSALNAFLVFQRGYSGATGDDAPYHREGFRLWMKKEGFLVPEQGLRAFNEIRSADRKAPLTDAEQFKLDCLTIHALCDPLRRTQLSALERRTLDSAMERFDNRLGVSRPEDLVAKWKDAFAMIELLDRYDGDPRTDRQTLLRGAIRALGYEGSRAKLADAVDRWLVTTSPDGADLQRKWREAMRQITDPRARVAFCDLVQTFFDEKRPLAGAQLGLYRALLDPNIRNNPLLVAQSIGEEAKKEAARRKPKK